MRGYIQVYTGNGKGKTTAALGLSIRAAGAGLKVFIIQFMKMGDYSEIKALQKFPDQITIEQYGKGKFVKGKPSREDID
ncbi:MAG: cob(I)yrinic acid a,c-diamide adenosyltransferase, partial [Desulfobacterales bacterium]|nr:cob(I)yrinic acid a,c-diamide adenosyltransferase [Desulfobacterales bacterium]